MLLLCYLPSEWGLSFEHTHGVVGRINILRFSGLIFLGSSIAGHSERNHRRGTGNFLVLTMSTASAPSIHDQIL